MGSCSKMHRSCLRAHVCVKVWVWVGMGVGMGNGWVLAHRRGRATGKAWHTTGGEGLLQGGPAGGHWMT